MSYWRVIFCVLSEVSVWESGALSCWQWCIAALRGSRICKHALENPKDKCERLTRARAAERERVCVCQGGRDSAVVANEEGQVIKLSWACVSLPLSNTVWNDQWAKIKWSQAKIGCLMKMDCVLTHSSRCVSVSEWKSPFQPSAHRCSLTLTWAGSLNHSSGRSTDRQSLHTNNPSYSQ